MLRQQELQQTKETLVARDAEVQELKARVAELEQLKQQQEQLVALKDSELAAAQQRLATTQAAATQAADAKVPMSMGPWLGVGAGLLVIGLLAGWWLRRRRAPAEMAHRDPRPAAPATPEPAEEDQAPQGAFADDQIPSQTESLPAEPAWNRLAKPAEQAPERPVPQRAVPTWHAGDFEVGPLNPAPPGQGRLDLARAYLDMGDRDTARSLLQEVAARGDTLSVRQEATRLLHELG
jgi:pilus assembly protein FimV